jgi:hypothetical protein
MSTCFVVMGYGKKTDFATGRTLDLDKSYKFLIKPAVRACGLDCVRADEIRHTGQIEAPMYEQLLNADVVVADLSTANPNAFYELGVRHALRPRTTVVIAESKLMYPFDVNHIAIRSYVHLGDVIDIEEAEAFRQKLSEAIEAVMATPRTDSPVYTFLPRLQEPRLGPSLDRVGAERSAPTARPDSAIDSPAVGALLGQANAAFDNGDFATARALFDALAAMRPTDRPWTINDTYLQQRRALATFKSKSPTPRAALEAARGHLTILGPDTSNDTETLGLWGSIHKRLWELGTASDADARGCLDVAIRAYERGYYLRNDYYNGINFAFLLNARAVISAAPDAIADFVHARRVRTSVLAICDPLARQILEKATSTATARPDNDTEQDYWVVATMAEALVGLDREAEASTWMARASGLPGVKSWMRDTTLEQLGKLRVLLADSPLKWIAGNATI